MTLAEIVKGILRFDLPAPDFSLRT